MKRTSKKQKERAAREARLEAARQVVATGTCPDCGAPLCRNLSLSGWYQCAAYGAPGFRGGFDGSGRSHPEYDALPACSFQTFTQ